MRDEREPQRFPLVGSITEQKKKRTSVSFASRRIFKMQKSSRFVSTKGVSFPKGHASHITHHASHITFTFTKRVANRIQTGCCQKINYNINIFFFSLFIFIYLLINLFVYVFICFLLRLESQPAVITGSRNG